MIEVIKKYNPDNIGITTLDNTIFEPELIKMCQMNRCGCYGKNYTCPPHVGNPDELIQKIKKYKNVIVFNKVYNIEDSFDLEGMIRGKNDFKRFTQDLYDNLRQHHKDFIFLGAGGCKLAIGVLSELRFKYIKIPVNCVKMLANTSSIRCAFALFTKIFIIFKFFDLKDLYF